MPIPIRSGLIFFLLVLLASACTSSTPTQAPSDAPGTLIINEVMPKGDTDQPPWAELKNPGGTSAVLAGATLLDGSGHTYTVPADAPVLPGGNFVVVFFDGLGSEEDEYDLSDGVTLHSDSAMVFPFEDVGDQLSLFNAASRTQESMLDFVAWGIEAVDDDAAAAEGLWLQDTYAASERGGLTTGSSQPGESIGLLPGQTSGLSSSWAIYSAEATTRGENNGVPTTEVTIPANGAALLSQDFRLTWYNVPFAARYVLQVDDDESFSSPEVEVTLNEPYYAIAPAAGTYFWRTKAINLDGAESPFSPGSEVTILDAEPLVLPMPPIEEDSVFSSLTPQLGMASVVNVAFSPVANTITQTSFWEVDYINSLVPLLQKKDSNLLCWDGDDETGARKPWDGPHNDGPGDHALHGRNYCARASSAMINHYYGGDLSQDRITFEHWGGGALPAGDLGHDIPAPYPVARTLFSWSLNNTPVTLTFAKPTFAQIQAWTTAGTGVMSSIPGHAIVLRGWAIYNGTAAEIPAGTQFVIYNDPWDGLMHVERYADINLVSSFVPGGTPTGRNQEASVTLDPDNDGIMSFDETKRFGTNPNDDDTDDDCVLDKTDMHSFVYFPHGTFRPRLVDFDGDGLQKHVDSDHDNGGAIDGDEDANRNGHLDALETDNRDASDDPRAPGGCSPPPTPAFTPTSGVMPPTSEPTETESGLVDLAIAAAILFDKDGHGPFANLPTEFVLLLQLFGGFDIGFFGSGTWVDVEGTMDDLGNFMATGTGTVAGYSNITASFEGTFADGMLEGEYTLGGGGGLPGGSPITYALVGEVIEPEPEATPAPGEQDLQTFYAAFNAQFETQNASGLFDLLHPAVIELYGAEACQAYLASVVESPIGVEVTKVIEFGPWDWEIDGQTNPIDDVYKIGITILTQDGPVDSESHVGLRPDGTLGWFTDCGDPLN